MLQVILIYLRRFAWVFLPTCFISIVLVPFVVNLLDMVWWPVIMNHEYIYVYCAVIPCILALLYVFYCRHYVNREDLQMFVKHRIRTKKGFLVHYFTLSGLLVNLVFKRHIDPKLVEIYSLELIREFAPNANVGPVLQRISGSDNSAQGGKNFDEKAWADYAKIARYISFIQPVEKELSLDISLKDAMLDSDHSELKRQTLARKSFLKALSLTPEEAETQFVQELGYFKRVTRLYGNHVSEFLLVCLLRTMLYASRDPAGCQVEDLLTKLWVRKLGLAFAPDFKELSVNYHNEFFITLYQDRINIRQFYREQDFWKFDDEEEESDSFDAQSGARGFAHDKAHAAYGSHSSHETHSHHDFADGCADNFSAKNDCTHEGNDSGSVYAYGNEVFFQHASSNSSGNQVAEQAAKSRYSYALQLVKDKMSKTQQSEQGHTEQSHEIPKSKPFQGYAYSFTAHLEPNASDDLFGLDTSSNSGTISKSTSYGTDHKSMPHPSTGSCVVAEGGDTKACSVHDGSKHPCAIDPNAGQDSQEGVTEHSQDSVLPVNVQATSNLSLDSGVAIKPCGLSSDKTEQAQGLLDEYGQKQLPEQEQGQKINVDVQYLALNASKNTLSLHKEENLLSETELSLSDESSLQNTPELQELVTPTKVDLPKLQEPNDILPVTYDKGDLESSLSSVRAQEKAESRARTTSTESAERTVSYSYEAHSPKNMYEPRVVEGANFATKPINSTNIAEPTEPTDIHGHLYTQQRQIAQARAEARSRIKTPQMPQALYESRAEASIQECRDAKKAQRLSKLNAELQNPLHKAVGESGLVVLDKHTSKEGVVNYTLGTKDGAKSDTHIAYSFKSAPQGKDVDSSQDELELFSLLQADDLTSLDSNSAILTLDHQGNLTFISDEKTPVLDQDQQRKERAFKNMKRPPEARVKTGAGDGTHYSYRDSYRQAYEEAFATYQKLHQDEQASGSANKDTVQAIKQSTSFSDERTRQALDSILSGGNIKTNPNLDLASNTLEVESELADLGLQEAQIKQLGSSEYSSQDCASNNKTADTTDINNARMERIQHLFNPQRDDMPWTHRQAQEQADNDKTAPRDLQDYRRIIKEAVKAKERGEFLAEASAIPSRRQDLSLTQSFIEPVQQGEMGGVLGVTADGFYVGGMAVKGQGSASKMVEKTPEELRRHAFAVLELDESATIEQIKTQYQGLAKCYNPEVIHDYDGMSEHQKYLLYNRLMSIRDAYEYLMEQSGQLV